MLVFIYDLLIYPISIRVIWVMLTLPLNYLCIKYGINIGNTDLFSTESQYLILKWFKLVILYQASNAGDIPFPLTSLV